MLRRCENNAKAVDLALRCQNAIDLTALFLPCAAVQQSQPVQRDAAVERQPLWLEFVAYMHVPSRWPALQPWRRKSTGDKL